MYYRILGYVDTIDDSSYSRNEKQPDGTKKEVIVEQYTYNLRVPGQKDFTRVTIGADVEGAPSKDQRDKWEDIETLVSIEADRLTTVAGGGDEGKAWGFASFHGTAIKEAAVDEQRAIKSRRKQIKEQQHARREESRRAKAEAKKAA
jgi:hypothetical protein